MKTVLMISYFYPPLGGIGMLRSLKFAEFFPIYGWRPIILTPKNGRGFVSCPKSLGCIDGVRVVRTKYYDLEAQIYRKLGLSISDDVEQIEPALHGSKYRESRLTIKFLIRMGRFIRPYLYFPDSQVGWYRFALAKALSLIRNEDIDLIYSTSPPETSHLIAASLKKRTGLPWVADMRDLWTQNPVINRPRLRKKLEEILEKAVIRRATHVITVSDPLAMDFVELHPNLQGKVSVITNGFDPHDFPRGIAVRHEKLSFTYTGRLYGLRRTPELLFLAIAELSDHHLIDLDHIEINFYLEDPNSIADMVKKYGLDDVVKLSGFIPHDQSVIRQQESQVLLLLLADDDAEKGVYTGKVFEYLGARRPILAIPASSEVVGDLLSRTQAGVAISDLDHLKRQLLAWYKEFLDSGEVRYMGIDSEIMKFTRQNKTRELAGLFNQVIEKSQQWRKEKTKQWKSGGGSDTLPVVFATTG